MSTLADLPEMLAEAARRHGVPGAAVAVGLGDELVEAATGVLNRNTGVEATPDSLFQIGSVTKVWTAALVLQLVDEGLVDLDHPARTYLPEFAVTDVDATETVTVRQLLSHTGGFVGDLFEDTGRGDDALARYIPYLHGAGQVHAPGALFSYCNSGFNVLGALVARLRGTGTWERTIRDYLIGPLGATHVALLAEEAILFRAAAGHTPGPDGPSVVTPWQMPRSGAPAGSTMCAAPRELVRFGRMFVGGGSGLPVLSADAVAAMRQPQVAVPGLAGFGAASWGLGCQILDWGGTAAIGHGGDTPGQRTVWRVVPDHGLVIAMNANGPGAPPLFEDILVRVVREATGVAVPLLPRPPSEPVAAGDVSAFLGRYVGFLSSYEVAGASEGLDGLDVTVEPGEFMARFGARRTISRYVRVSGDTFLAADPDDGYHYQVTFVDNGRYLHNGRAVPRV